MAAVLKLSYIDPSAGATDLNLIDTSGIMLEGKGWIPKVASVGAGGVAQDVMETLTVYIVGTSHDDVATNEQALSDMMRRAGNYWRDVNRRSPVWLYAQLSGETNARRALVKEISWRWISQHYSEEMIDFKPRLKITINRMGAWEALTASTYEEVAAVASLGGQFDYTGAPASDVVGTLPSRLNDLFIWESAVNTSVMWAGIRSAELHTIGAYDPVWTFAADFVPDVDAADVADATAFDGNRMEIDFAVTPGWARRASAGGTNLDGDNTGDHLILLRAYTDVGTEADIKILFSLTSANEDAIYTSIQGITDNAWTIYPISGALLNYEDSPNVEFWARRTNGAGSLHIDCLVFIPVDAFFLFVEGTNVIGPALGTSFGWSVREDGVIQGHSSLTGRDVGNVQMEGPGVPIGHGVMVICGARSGRASTKTDTFTLKMNHLERWAALRGSE